jgi:hypothetical protein
MEAYNNFYHLVKAECACDQAMDMERELLNHCMLALKGRGTIGKGSPELSPGGEQADDASAEEPLVAGWDL